MSVGINQLMLGMSYYILGSTPEYWCGRVQRAFHSKAEQGDVNKSMQVGSLVTIISQEAFRPLWTPNL